MPRLTPLTCKQIERKLTKLGFNLDYTDGNICYYTRIVDGKEAVVQVHRHPGERGLDIIKTIIRTGNISRDEWMNV